MKMYKGFDKDLKCRDFQYEIGKTYTEDKAELCEVGFHACEHPLDCLNYYEPGESRYCDVDLDDVTDECGEDSKRVGKKITVQGEIGIAGLVKAAVNIGKAHAATTGEWAHAATTGEWADGIFIQGKLYSKKKLCLDWFQMSNDGFYDLYGFNFNPHEYPGLYDWGRKTLYGG